MGRFMAVGLDNKELLHLKHKLKSGEYDGADLMYAWIALDELIELREFRDKAFLAYPNIDIDIERIDT
jgi:hypothetical protein